MDPFTIVIFYLSISFIFASIFLHISFYRASLKGLKYFSLAGLLVSLGVFGLVFQKSIGNWSVAFSYFLIFLALYFYVIGFVKFSNIKVYKLVKNIVTSIFCLGNISVLYFTFIKNLQSARMLTLHLVILFSFIYMLYISISCRPLYVKNSYLFLILALSVISIVSVMRIFYAVANFYNYPFILEFSDIDSLFLFVQCISFFLMNLSLLMIINRILEERLKSVISKEFVRKLTHDIINPLSIASGFATVISRRNKDLPENFEKINDSIKRIELVVSKFRDEIKNRD